MVLKGPLLLPFLGLLLDPLTALCLSHIDARVVQHGTHVGQGVNILT